MANLFNDENYWTEHTGKEEEKDNENQQENLTQVWHLSFDKFMKFKNIVFKDPKRKISSFEVHFLIFCEFLKITIRINTYSYVIFFIKIEKY